jgi:site-specific DNA recombinase
VKNADLYVRVSTDEQADKGYSLRGQQEALIKYCEVNNIKIRKIFVEDHSAKTFIRPEWKKLMIHVRKYKGKAELLLFTKWDRFSRNTSDAYQMIASLRKLGIDPQAIEQPLDLNVPENKMMLAVYLTTPEIENDRRGLNTKIGIRQAKKEGRWMGMAPLGYANKAYENGRRYIAVQEPEATIMKWVFDQLAEGIYSGEQILNLAREKGLKCSKNNFYLTIRNPVYCGKIRLPQYKDEEARLVQGLHEPLISESHFYHVQDILDGRKREYGTPISSPKDLPLRGFLRCPKCSRMLTGSASRGKNKHFIYYHCTSSCGVRYRADAVNERFIQELMEFLPKKGFDELFVEVITDCYNNQTRSIQDERKLYIQQINEQNRKMDKARELLLENDIDSADFRSIKAECNEKITRLEAKLSDLQVQNASLLNIRPIAEKAILNLQNLDILYEEATTEGKRYLVGTLFPDNLIYDGEVYRTPIVNEAAELVYLKNKELRAKKMGQKSLEKISSHKG